MVAVHIAEPAVRPLMFRGRPHFESLGPGCTTTWPAVRRGIALRSSIAGVAFRADGCLPSGGRARSESVSASCAMVGWALSIGLIDLPFTKHWTHVTFKQHGCRRDAVTVCFQCHGNVHVAIILFTSRYLSLRRMTLSEVAVERWS